VHPVVIGRKALPLLSSPARGLLVWTETQGAGCYPSDQESTVLAAVRWSWNICIQYHSPDNDRTRLARVVHVSGQVLYCSCLGLVVGGYQLTASIHFEILPLEDGGGVFLLNVGSHLPDYTVT